MTENEIVNYLKENENKGIVFEYMPDEVKAWCEEHKEDLIFFIKSRWVQCLEFEEEANIEYKNYAVALSTFYKYIDYSNGFKELKKYMNKKLKDLTDWLHIARKGEDIVECLKFESKIELLQELLEKSDKV